MEGTRKRKKGKAEVSEQEMKDEHVLESDLREIYIYICICIIYMYMYNIFFHIYIYR